MTEQRLKPISLPASGDLSASQYCFVTTNNAGNVAVTGAGLSADGVLQDKPTAAGQSSEVAPLDGCISKVVVGGTAATLTAGDLVASDAAGKAVTATTGNYILGRALATRTTGQVAPVLLFSMGKL
jgi:hypothetical protein